MTLKFYNGTNYQGLTFTTATQGLELIRDSLIGAGWVVELDDIVNTLTLNMKGVDEDQNSPQDECFINFYSDTSNQIKCSMYFDNEGTLEESPAKIFNFYEGLENYMFLTCDSGSGILMILRNDYLFDGLLTKPSNVDLHPSLKTVHFGFLERITFSDKNGIALGEPDFRLHNCFMQKTFHQNNIWDHVHNTWVNESLSNDDKAWGINSGLNYSAFTNNSDGASFPCHSTTDFITCSFVSGGRYSRMNGDNGNYDYIPSFGSGGNGSGSDNDKNAAYMMFKGNVNGVNGLPLLNRFGYIEGHGNSTSYGDNMGSENTFPHQYYFRGWVKFVATGMGSLNPLQQIKENNGTRWMSAGRAGFQGIQLDTE